ncbi:MAG: PAS domain S-box protein [Alphaproteobacteria bacterium]|nr:PAS domain S-box protein [Alphaproteobacteria bacterium]
MVAGLLSNIGLLSLCAIGLFVVASRVRMYGRAIWRDLLVGVVFGLVSALVINYPVVTANGSTFDSRVAPALLAGVFAGPWGAVPAVVIGAIARLDVGGPFAMGAVAGLAIYGGLGVAIRRWWYLPVIEKTGTVGPLHFAAMGAVATVTVLPAFFIGPPAEVAVATLEKAGAVFLGANVLSVLILGVLCVNVRQVIDERDDYFRTLWTAELAGNAAKIGVFDFKPQEGDLVWNRQMFSIYGVEPKDFTGEHDFFRERVHRDDLAEVERVFSSAIEQESDFEHEFRIIRPDGETRYIRAKARRFYVPGTSRSRIIGVNWDVTDEVVAQMENSLRSHAIESANQGMVITSAGPGKPVVSVNRAFLRITGYSKEEVIGRSLKILQGPKTDRVELERMRSCMDRAEIFSGTLCNYRKDGSLFFNHMKISPVIDDTGEICHFAATLEDVTETVSLSKESQRMRFRLNTILETAPDAFITMGADRKIKSFNAAAEILFGWSRDEVVGEDINTLVPEKYRPGHHALQESYLGNKNAKPGPMSFFRLVDARKRDGSTFPALVTIGRFEIDGEAEVTAIAHDMTEFVNVNRALEDVSQQLSEQLARAEDANVAKTRFLANMSHELRTPLNAIIGFSETMRHGIFGPLDDRYRAYAEDIHASGHHLLDLINDVLDVARLERDTVDLDCEPVGARDVIYRALRATRPMLNDKTLKVRTVVPRSLPEILLDRRSIQQCLLNVLSNSIRHTAKGGRILIGARVEKGRIDIFVSDNGEGIAPDRLPRIGRPFESATNVDSHVSENRGTGLGLAITKQLTEAMDGRFKIESVLGEGTTVTLSFPIPDDSATREPPDSPSVAPSRAA